MSVSPLVQAIMAHQDALSRQSMVMDEWPDAPEVFWKPVTLNDRNKANEKKGAGKLLMAVILKAEDKDGNKLFSIADYTVMLAHLDEKGIIRLANKMLGAEDEDEAGNE